MALAGLPRAREWLVLAAALAAALLLAEALCRYALPRPGFVPLMGNWLPGAVRPHPSRLYSLAPGFSARVDSESVGRMQVQVNADGLRERPLEALQSAALRILAVGDSFTFGYGLDQGLAWPRQLERALAGRAAPAPIAVINAGVPGYNVAQMDDSLRELLPKARPHLVVAAVYAGGFDRLENPLTALGDVVIRSNEARGVRRVEGGLVRSRMHRQVLVDVDLWLLTHWYFGARAFEAAFDLIDAAREIARRRAQAAAAMAPARDPLRGVGAGLGHLARMQERARAAGIPMVVLVITRLDAERRPHPQDVLVAGELRRFCEARDIPCLDPREQLAVSDATLQVRPGDYHWSAAANAIAAQALADFLLARGLVPARPTAD